MDKSRNLREGKNENLPSQNVLGRDTFKQTCLKILAVVRSEIASLRMLFVKRVVIMVHIEKSAKKFSFTCFILECHHVDQNSSKTTRLSVVFYEVRFLGLVHKEGVESALELFLTWN